MKAQTKKVFEDTVTTMKNQFGEAERVLNESLEQVNTRFQSAEKDAREKLTQLRDQIQLDGVKSRLETVNLAKQGARIGAETVELLGLAQVADLEKLSAKLDRFATKAETLRRRTTDITALKKAAKDAERAQAKMEKRVAKLEKSVLDLSKKLAAAKAKKAPAAKKPATKKTPSKSRTAKK